VPKKLLRFVKSYRDHTGKLRHYFRRKGSPSVALPGTPGSREFMRAYEEALGDAAPTVRKVGEHVPGSVGALIADYKRSAAFANLKPSSKRVYNLALDKFGNLHGHRLVKDAPRSKIAEYIGRIGVESPGMANLTRSVLRKLFVHAVKPTFVRTIR
jgi:hypothetical protein